MSIKSRKRVNKAMRERLANAAGHKTWQRRRGVTLPTLADVMASMTTGYLPTGTVPNVMRELSPTGRHVEFNPKPQNIPSR